jgi:2-polyprenyl-3-methyl-5-hydroxy-6-metoxy-1,4-benzoquinol methylase
MQKSQKMYFYNSIAEKFDDVVNIYDTKKRLQVIFNELLPKKLTKLKLLDAGCGTGWFSKAAAQKGAQVTSMDIGPKLLQQVKKKCRSKRVVGSVMNMPFKKEIFDVVISTEVIEHVTHPDKALKEFYRVLKPNGVLVLTTPNHFWHFSLFWANLIGVRPYQGLENWYSWAGLRQKLEKLGFIVEEQKGIHAFPFISRYFYPILDFLHTRQKFFAPFMVNIAIRCRKPVVKKYAKKKK